MAKLTITRIIEQTIETEIDTDTMSHAEKVQFIKEYANQQVIKTTLRRLNTGLITREYAMDRLMKNAVNMAKLGKDILSFI
jgi:hypothetical protein